MKNKSNKQLFKSEYEAWRGARNRTTNSKHKRWSDYGGRGITMCDRWLDSFDNFIADMQPKSDPSLSLDRIDNDGNYEPGNCRWATSAEQSVNRRVRKDARLLTIDGETKTLWEWAREAEIDVNTIKYRMRKHGWTDKRLLSPPDTSKQSRLKK